MIRTPFLIGAVLLTALLTGYVVGCVTIPDTGPTPPNYIANVRIVNVDPALSSGGIIRIAAGPFDAAVTPTYTDLPFGAPGIASAYAVFPAGGKKLFVSNVDADTGAISFNSDNSGTMYILPRFDVKKDSRFLYFAERFTFAAAPGISDTTRICFYNAIATFDTVNVRRAFVSGSGAAVDEVFSSSLRFQKVSAFDRVGANSTRKYYVTAVRNGVTLPAAVGDTVFVTGVGHSDLYVMLYDSLSVLKVKTFQAN